MKKEIRGLERCQAFDFLSNFQDLLKIFYLEMSVVWDLVWDFFKTSSKTRIASRSDSPTECK